MSTHHQSRASSLQANISATIVHASTITEAVFAAACIVYRGSLPSFRTANPPINLTSNAESSTTPCAAAVIPPIDFILAASTKPISSFMSSLFQDEPRLAAWAAPAPLPLLLPAERVFAQARISSVITSSTWSSFSGAPWSVYNQRH